MVHPDAFPLEWIKSSCARAKDVLASYFAYEIFRLSQYKCIQLSVVSYVNKDMDIGLEAIVMFCSED